MHVCITVLSDVPGSSRSLSTETTATFADFTNLKPSTLAEVATSIFVLIVIVVACRIVEVWAAILSGCHCLACQ
jgi:hypothetical protein